MEPWFEGAVTALAANEIALNGEKLE